MDPGGRHRWECLAPHRLEEAQVVARSVSVAVWTRVLPGSPGFWGLVSSSVPADRVADRFGVRGRLSAEGAYELGVAEHERLLERAGDLTDSAKRGFTVAMIHRRTTPAVRPTASQRLRTSATFALIPRSLIDPAPTVSRLRAIRPGWSRQPPSKRAPRAAVRFTPPRTIWLEH